MYGISCLKPGSVSTSERGRKENAAGSRIADRNASSVGRNPWKYPAARNRSVGITRTRSSEGMRLQYELEQHGQHKRDGDHGETEADGVVAGAAGEEAIEFALVAGFDGDLEVEFVPALRVVAEAVLAVANAR